MGRIGGDPSATATGKYQFLPWRLLRTPELFKVKLLPARLSRRGDVTCDSRKINKDLNGPQLDTPYVFKVLISSDVNKFSVHKREKLHTFLTAFASPFLEPACLGIFVIFVTFFSISTTNCPILRPCSFLCFSALGLASCEDFIRITLFPSCHLRRLLPCCPFPKSPLL